MFGWFVKLILSFGLVLFGIHSMAAIELDYHYYNYQKKSTSTAVNWRDIKRPLIVWIHGCNQTPDRFVEISNVVAETAHLNPIIMAPNSKSKLNVLKCWNFLSQEMKHRDGEYMTIINEIQQLIDSGAVDPRRVFIGGFSSGAIFANHLALCYPDIFKGALIHSGGPFDASGSMTANSARANAQDAINCAGPSTKVQLKTLFYVHGEKDKVVLPILGRNAFEQAVTYFDTIDDRKVNDSALTVYHNLFDGLSVNYSQGVSIHHLEVAGMKHRWSGSLPGSNFSSPGTVNVIQLFLNITNSLR